jgi:glutathione S-transferase
MSDDFDSLDAREKAAAEAALNRCRALAAQIDKELHNQRHERFVDKLSLADFCASLEYAANVLETERPAAGREHTCFRREGFAGAATGRTTGRSDENNFEPLRR